MTKYIELDAIGVLHESADEGESLNALPGWHVNATHPVAGWGAWRVTPATPRRVFAGVATVFYTFPDKGTFETAMDTADLVEPDPEPEPATRRITKLAFRNRFTQAEKVAIEIAQLDIPTAAMQARAQSAALRSSQADVMAGSFIDLDRADTRGGVQALEAFGLIASGRALQILDAEINDLERPK